MKFKNFAEATDVLIYELAKAAILNSNWQALAVGEISKNIAAKVAAQFDLAQGVIEVHREVDKLGYVNQLQIQLPEILKPKLLICDLGVETGTTASAIAEILLASDAIDELAIAALVVPKEMLPLLRANFHHVISARSPLIRRSLAWEFEEFA